MNGENDKLIRDFMNAFEKKGVKVAMKDVNLPIRFWRPEERLSSRATSPSRAGPLSEQPPS